MTIGPHVASALLRSEGELFNRPDCEFVWIDDIRSHFAVLGPNSPEEKEDGRSWVLFL